MSTCRPLTILCLLTCCGLFTGCGGASSSTAEVASDDTEFLDDLMSDFEEEDGAEKPERTVSLTIDPGLAEPAVPVASADVPQQLQLRLQPGDRFPLVKTIRQNLVQTSADAPASANSQLDMHMVIQIDDVNDRAILMNVRYTRIRYSHDINGQAVEFDSDTHQHAVPADILPYAGMVNNGFAFWLGRDNKIQELVGYQAFLEKCVQAVPVERRQNLLTEIASRFGDDGVANFIDDTVGLLPYNPNASAEDASQVAVGDVWYRERRLMHPMPVYMKSTCRLLSLNKDTAEIDITGQIANTETATAGPSGVQIRNGRSIGSCVVDRATGLPLKLNRSRYLTMTVTGADGRVYEQEKRIETTIQAFPDSRGPVVSLPAQPQTRPNFAPPTPQLSTSPGNGFAPPQSPIQQVNGISPANGSNAIQQLGSQKPVPRQLDVSNLKSEVRAVYPDQK